MTRFTDLFQQPTPTAAPAPAPKTTPEPPKVKESVIEKSLVSDDKSSTSK